jgi:antitoxin ParD1/3/4
MRTNIEIDDKLMEAAMAAGGFKTKREAVEEGLRLVARRKVYDGLRALRGKLHWDDSDEGWTKVREQQALVVNEAAPAPYVAVATKVAPVKRGRTK